MEKRLSPVYVTGLFDAEGFFYLGLDKNKQPRFTVGLGLTNRHHSFILNLQEFFEGEGSISLNSVESRIYFANVNTILKIIIPHFDKYALISNKLADYLLFKQGFFLISSGAYKTPAGLLEFAKISSEMNSGMKLSILRHFSESDLTTACDQGCSTLVAARVSRPVVELPTNLDPWWITGFVDGDGGFTASIKYRETSFRIQPFFGITQHLRDELLITMIKNYFKVGNVYLKKGPKHNYIQYAVSSYKDNLNTVIPHFDQYPLQSPKSLPYSIWKELIILLAKGRNKTDADKKRSIELVSNIHKLNTPIKATDAG